MMRNIFLKLKYKPCKYFARKNNNSKINLFGKFAEEYGKTPLSKEEIKMNEKNLELKKYPAANKAQRDVERVIEEGLKSGKSESQIMEEMYKNIQSLPEGGSTENDEAEIEKIIGNDHEIIKKMKESKKNGGVGDIYNR
jgi:hypothetical protein